MGNQQAPKPKESDDIDRAVTQRISTFHWLDQRRIKDLFLTMAVNKTFEEAVARLQVSGLCFNDEKAVKLFCYTYAAEVPESKSARRFLVELIEKSTNLLTHTVLVPENRLTFQELVVLQELKERKCSSCPQEEKANTGFIEFITRRILHHRWPAVNFTQCLCPNVSLGDITLLMRIIY